jgi:hypothetical protein
MRKYQLDLLNGLGGDVTFGRTDELTDVPTDGEW